MNKKFFSINRYRLFALGLLALASLTLALVPATRAADEVGDYRSVAAGNWNVNGTWEVCTGSGDPGTFGAADHQPGTADGKIDIRNGNTVTVGSGMGVNADQIVVSSGGTMSVTAKANMTLSDGPGVDLDIYGSVSVFGTTGITLSSGSPSITVRSGGSLSGSYKSAIMLTSPDSPALDVFGTVTLSNAAMVATAGSPSVTVENGGVVNLNGSSAMTFGGGGSPTITINSGGTLNAVATRSALILNTTGSPTITINSGGVANVGGPGTGGPPLQALNGNPTITVSGTLNLAATRTAIVVNNASSTLTVNVESGGLVNDAVLGGVGIAQEAGTLNLTVKNGATYAMTAAGGSVSTATWQDGSLLVITNAGAPGGGFSQSFYDLVWNSASQSASADAASSSNMVVRRNFTINDANAKVIKNFPGSSSVSIGGDLAITNATFNLCGSAVAGGTLSIAGNLSVASGAALDVSASVTAPVKVNFVGGGSHTFYQGGSINNATRYAWLVDAGNTVTLSGGDITINGGTSVSTFTNNGTLVLGVNAIKKSSDPGGFFVAGPGSTTKLGAAFGIGTNSTANIQVNNGNVFDATANYEFNGGVAQVTGGNFPGTINNLTINNAAGVGLGSSVTANGTVSLTSGTLDLAGNNLSAAQLSASGTINNSTGSSTLTYGSSGNSVSFGGALTDGGSGTPLGLTKSGAGALTLTASNPYHGNTVINNGALVLSGSGAIPNSPVINLAASTSTFDVSGVSGSFTLGSGQTLSGIGVVVGSVTVASGGGVAPGNSPGTIVFTNDLTLNSGATTYFDLDNSPNPSDKVEVGGNLTPGGSTIDVTVVGTSLEPGTYTLFHYGGARFDTFNSTVVVHGTVNGLPSLEYDGVNNNVNLVVATLSVDSVAFTTQPSDAAAGSAISPAVVVHVSSGGSPVAGAYVTMSLTNSTGTLSGTLTRQTDGSGNATFNDLSIDLIGTKYLQAQCGSVSNASTSFVISSGSAAKLTVVQQPSDTATAGVAFGQQPIVQVLDQFGNVVSNATDTITAAASSGTLQGTTAVAANGTDGTATFTDLAATAAGVIHLTFSSGVLTPVNSSDITNSAAEAAQLLITTAIASPQAGGTPFMPSPVVKVADQFGNATTSNAVIDANLSSTDGTGTLGGTTQETAAGGVATFNNLSFSLGGGVAENIVVYFTSPGLTSVTNSLVTVNPVAHFRSKASGNWDDINTWEMSFDNSNWSDAATTPTSADGMVTIVNGMTVTVVSEVTVDQVTVQVGGTLVVATNVTLTVADGPGTDLVVQGNLVDSSTTITNIGTISVEDGGVYQLAKNAGPIMTATWQPGSTCEITGFTGFAGKPAGWGQTFHHFTFNSPALANNNNFVNDLLTVNGNLTFKSFNTRYQKLGGSGTGVVNVGGDFIIDPGTGGRLSLLNGGGSQTVNVGGSVYVQSGTFQITDNASATGILNVSNGLHVAGGATLGLGTAGVTKQINFVGSGTQVYSNDGTVSNAITWTVASGSTLDVGTSVISGTNATFTLSGGGGLRIGSTDGITATAASGNIQVTGARSYSSAADYTYSGVVAQVPGDGLPATVNNLTIENPAGLTLDSTVTVNGVCTVASGGLLNGNGTVNGAMVIDGTLAPGTSIGTFTIGNSPIINGTLEMEISSPSSADKLVVSGNPLTYGGTLTVINIGGEFAGGEVFDLFDASGFSGSFAAMNLPSLDSGKNWYTDSLTSDGTIQIVAEGVNGQGKTVRVVNGTATVSFIGASGREYVTQRRTNLVAGVWVDIATNTAPGDGLFAVTDTFDDLGGTNHAPRSAYYRLKSQ